MAPLAPRPATLGWSVLIGLIAVVLAVGAGWFVATATLLSYAAVAGPPGEPGPEGPGGAPGPHGPQGPTGETGRTGAAGATGATGSTGVAGADGPSGAPGAPGATGAVGPTGDAGATGSVGPRGASGPLGADGARGERGVAGPPGPQGATGPTGPAGDGSVIVRTQGSAGDETTVSTGPLTAGVWVLTAASTVTAVAKDPPAALNPALSCFIAVNVGGSETRTNYLVDHLFRGRIASYVASIPLTVVAGASVSAYSGCSATDNPDDIEVLALTTTATLVGDAP